MGAPLGATTGNGSRVKGPIQRVPPAAENMRRAANGLLVPNRVRVTVLPLEREHGKKVVEG